MGDKWARSYKFERHQGEHMKGTGGRKGKRKLKLYFNFKKSKGLKYALIFKTLDTSESINWECLSSERAILCLACPRTPTQYPDPHTGSCSH